MIELIKDNRIFEIIDNLGNISSSKTGCSRFSYSHEDALARQYIFGLFEELELEVSVDPAGNIYARYAPESVRSMEPVMTGSHIDTVPNGGKYDGVLGVATAIEVLRTIIEKDIKILRPVEIVVFAEEEGSNFGITSLGSKLVTGKLDYEELQSLRSYQGIPAMTILSDFGLSPKCLQDYKIKDIFAFIELHIEQGPILDLAGCSLGIVDSIVGQRVYQVQVVGESNHAGTTPMRYRKDALVSASSMIKEIKQVAKNFGSENAVATVGKLKMRPNGTNVIPSDVCFWVDVRDTENDSLDKLSFEIDLLIQRLANENNCQSDFKLVGYSDPTNFSKEIVECLQDIVDELQFDCMVLPSGAGHDCGLISSIAPAGMIFIRTPKGISHNPFETVIKEDVLQGATVLLNAIIKLATSEKMDSCSLINLAKI